MRSYVLRFLLALFVLVLAMAPPLPGQSRTIAVVPDSVTLAPGDTARLSATVRAAGGAVLPAPSPLTYSSSDTSVVVVRAGKLTARAPGVATVRVMHGTYVRAQVAVVVRAAAAPPPAPAPALAFSSDWSTATGTGGAAVTDGGRWDLTACPTLPQVLAVVPGAPLGFSESVNVLRMQMRGWDCGTMQRTNAVPQSTSHWGRFYVRNDEQGTRNDHTFAYNNIHGGMGIQAVPFSRYAQNQPAGEWRASVILFFPYPYGRWYSPALRTGTWYRYEYHFEYLTPTTYRIWPRVYALDGTLVADASSFRHEDARATSPTLAAYYDVGGANRAAPLGVLNTETPRPEYARHLGIGNEGPSTSTATLGYWYYAKLALSTAGWIGR